MLKLIIKLIWQRANAQKWQLELGAHLLKKGCGYQIGQVIEAKKLNKNPKSKAKFISGLTYDFGTNQIYHRIGKTITKL
jgi:hypothetical protein